MKRIVAVMISIVMLMGVMPMAGMAAEVVYLRRDVNHGGPTEVAMSDYETYQTEHFQIFYDTDGANSYKVTEEFLAKCETVLENCWDLFIDKMGMEPTSTSVWPNGDHSTQYKTNVVLMGTGVDGYYLDANGWGAYGSVDEAGYPYFMCCIAAMDSPETVAHEFGHAVHYAQGDNAWENNIYLGPWFEAVANWFAEQYRYEYWMESRITPTALSPLYLRANHLTKMNGRAYYEAWPILQYLTEDPDGYGVYGDKFVQKLLSYDSGNTNTLFWEVLEACNGDVTVADTVGSFASHMATLDFANKYYYNLMINSYMSYNQLLWQQRYTMLEALGDVEDTYAVPVEKAPQAMGYNIIPLEFEPGEVSVTLNPLTKVKGADWRGRLVIESAEGKTSYSELFGINEKMTVTVSDTDKLYLTVAATPELETMSRHTIGGWAEHSKESVYPYENKKIYPYSVKLENAAPMERPMIKGSYKAHPNGGGMVATSASVADSAYVGPNAIVYGNAQVTDNAIIDGYAMVGGNAKISGNAYVGDYAIVFDRAEVTDNARVIENACIYVDYKVSGNAVVKGSSLGLYNGGVTGEAITYGDWFEDQGYTVAMGSYSGYHSLSSDDKYEKSRTFIPALRSRYDFNSDMRDTVAYSDLYEVGNVVIGEEYVSFDDNYIVLNESALYYDAMRIRLKVRGDGDVLNIGDSIILNCNDYMVNLKVGNAEVTEPWLSMEGWNEIEIEFDGKKAVLTANGKETAIETDITPVKAVRAGESYLGKGFAGDVDYLYILDTSCEVKPVEGTLEVNKKVFKAPEDENGTLIDRGNYYNSEWYGWETASSAIRVDNGLNFVGVVNTTVNTPGYDTDKFVIEFKPEGGVAYPDHGILDTDGDVLFAHRYAADASSIYIGRGEINDTIRGAANISDTAGQKRLTNFVAEKLYTGSARNDRGAISYTEDTKVKITAENYFWNETLAEAFADAENTTANLDTMKDGEAIYLVTYAVIDGEFEIGVSVSVYRGSFEGFGGFKTAGGAANATVSYREMSIEIYTAPQIVTVGNYIYVENFDGDGVVIFALYENDALKSVKTAGFTGLQPTEIPEGFEKGRVMVFDSTNGLKPLTEAMDIGQN